MTIDAVPGVAPAEGAAVPEPSAPSNIVEVRGETVTLYPKLPLDAGIAAATVAKLTARKALEEQTPFTDIQMAIIEGSLATIYLRFGIKEWTFRDAKGWREPITPDNVERLLPYNDGGREVAEAADALYSGEVFRPFRQAQEKLLQLMQQAPLTSPPSAGGPSPRKPSRPSSRNGTGGKRSAAPARSRGKRPT